MMLSWRRICQQFIDTDFGSDLPKFKDFTINYLGRPWANAQKNMEWSELRGRAEDYAYGDSELPGHITKDAAGQVSRYNGPLILTAGVDVQKDRLELQVVGFGIGMEKWSVDYHIFYGNPGNIDDPSWIALDEHIYTHTYRVAGQDSYISLCAVDSGYDPRSQTRQKDWTGKSSVVYEFVSQRPDRFIAIMGVDDQKVLMPIKEARVDGSNLKKRYNVATGIFKEMLYSQLDIVGGPGALHFPRYRVTGDIRREIPDDHYRQFLSERFQEIKPGNWGWKKIYKRNEVLDTFVYACAAAEFHGLSGWTAERWMQYYYEIVS
jgi:phage terminase large subunit GpA-like protein